jgi:hypothetical protein
MFSVAVVMIFAGLNVSAQDSACNLLSNAVFSTLNEKGNPEGWSASVSGFSLDPAVKPDGCEQSLKVAVAKEGKFLGDITQMVKVKPQTNYTFSCMVKASPGIGVLMVKLLDAKGGEIKRITSAANGGAEWEMLKTSFSTESSDTILVMLRYTQTGGQTLWFALPKLVEENKPQDATAK